MCLLYDDKGVRIDLHHDLLHICDLLPLYRRQHHLCVLVAVAALTFQEGCATVQLMIRATLE